MRDEILKLLLQKIGMHISGEDMAQRFGISRAAIWKHIDILKKMGCEIDCRPNKGYMLVSLPDSLAPEILRSCDFSGVIKRCDIRYYQTVESTNETAKELAYKGCSHATVVVADHQSKGKGRLMRGWESSNGMGLYTSIVLQSELRPIDVPKISIITALAVANTLNARGDVQARIKWPNDVMIGSRKICGILLEMSAELDRVHNVVVGIGININEDSFSDVLRGKATSLYMETGQQVSRSQILVALLTEFFALYDSFIAGEDFTAVVSAYSRLSMLIQKPVDIYQGGNVTHGLCVGFDREGYLVLEVDGKRLRVYGGDVSVRSNETYV